MGERTRVSRTPESFVFRGWEADDTAGRVRLRYSFDDAEPFCETLDFHHPLPDRASGRRAGFEAALDGLSLAAGISYYKARLPARLLAERRPLTAAQGAFFRKLYVHGLGEFAYRNRLEVASRVNFAVGDDDGSLRLPAAGALPRVSAVLLGGGKDSLVSVEVLKAAGEPIRLFAVNPRGPIVDCARASGLELISVARTIDPRLFQLNDAGAYNGHVPITAIISFIALAGAFVYGYDTVVLSNERSADEGNVVAEGLDVNHQYSKSSVFEADMQGYIAAHVASGLGYLSLLRPLSEVHIARLMAKTTRYDGCFTSCNKNFAIRAGAPPRRWCCDCPKCRFSFLAFATAMAPERLIGIFGANLLDDPSQIGGYAELAGLSDHKPWECVGEFAESSAALITLAADSYWSRTAVVGQLAPRLSALMPNVADVWKELLTPSAAHHLPRRYQEMLDAYIGER